jgi:hypothetical protein
MIFILSILVETFSAVETILFDFKIICKAAVVISFTSTAALSVDAEDVHWKEWLLKRSSADIGEYWEWQQCRVAGLKAPLKEGGKGFFGQLMQFSKCAWVHGFQADTEFPTLPAQHCNHLFPSFSSLFTKKEELE